MSNMKEKEIEEITKEDEELITGILEGDEE